MLQPEWTSQCETNKDSERFSCFVEFPGVPGGTNTSTEISTGDGDTGGLTRDNNLPGRCQRGSVGGEGIKTCQIPLPWTEECIVGRIISILLSFMSFG